MSFVQTTSDIIGFYFKLYTIFLIIYGYLNSTKTFNVLKNQLTNVLDKKFDKNNIIIAYEPVWSIGTGKLPTKKELQKTTIFIKKGLKSIFRKKYINCFRYFSGRKANS